MKVVFPVPKKIRFLTLVLVLTILTIVGLQFIAPANSTSPFPAGEKICFSRNYTNAHINSHPGQIVKSMRLDFKRGKKYSQLLYFFVHANLINSSGKELGAGGHCNSLKQNDPLTLRCRVHCDGGSFTASLKEDGSSILLENRGIGLKEPGEIKPNVNRYAKYLQPGSENKTFRLFKADCQKSPLDTISLPSASKYSKSG